MPTPAAIDINQLSVVLSHSFRAIDNVSLTIPAGHITGCLGPSGAGKTTLIRAVVGRQRPTSGHVTVLGLPAGSPALRRQVSYMTQAPSVYPDLTVAENLAYFAAMVDVPRLGRGGHINRILATVDMTKQANQLVSSLSGGQKQRVSLAVTLLGEPKLLVLDEPTVGLDPVLREQLWALFRRLAKAGTTILISSHVMDEAERCDSLLLLRDGRLLAQGTPAALAKQTGTKTVAESFLKLVEQPI